MPRIHPYQKGQFDLSLFDCGDPALNHHLQNMASQDQRRQFARTFIATSNEQVVGYYTLGGYGVEAIEVAPSVKQPPHLQIPVALLGKLAVDLRHQQQGMARHLLIDAIERYLTIRAHMGLNALLVDALNENAVRFYSHFGFKPIPGTTDRLALTDRTIVALAHQWAAQFRTMG